MYYKHEEVAKIKILDYYLITPKDIFKLFNTTDDKHPGVNKELNRSRLRVGSKIIKFNSAILKNSLNPSEKKKIFKEKKWNSVVGFQTRNPIHKAHEYLQRVGLEICDGLFINPLVGWKKRGDFSESAINAGYKVMINQFYPKTRVHFDQLKTQMRYAGPREAIFHALIRRNLGCTHFIIGRDHAGVGSYYGIYEAQEFAKKITKTNDLGLELLLIKEPYYCSICDGIVTQNHCDHYKSNRLEISGTIIRKDLSEGKIPDDRMMRPEVSKEILNLKTDIFVK